MLGSDTLKKSRPDRPWGNPLGWPWRPGWAQNSKISSKYSSVAQAAPNWAPTCPISSKLASFNLGPWAHLDPPGLPPWKPEFGSKDPKTKKNGSRAPPGESFSQIRRKKGPYSSKSFYRPYCQIPLLMIKTSNFNIIYLLFPSHTVAALHPIRTKIICILKLLELVNNIIRTITTRFASSFKSFLKVWKFI